VTASQQTRSPVGRDGRGPRERRMVPPAEPRSYYGRPVIKEPTWTPEIPVYFFTGGLAGASAGLAFGARLLGRRKLARTATANAFIGVALSPPLLISDLGVRKRFLNMLRVFKVTSPMSVGSWILSAEGALLTVTAAHEFLGWFPRPLARIAEAVAAALGMPLATYTAALIANTSVPVWHDARHELPFAFAGGSAMAAGGLAALLTPDEAGPARRLAILGALTEGASLEYSKRKMGFVAEAYTSGAAGRLEKATKTFAGGGAVLLVTAQATGSRRIGRLGSLMAVVGSMLGRWMVFIGGRQSAAAPQYTVKPQRERADQGKEEAQP
jgi:hypothetical protein